LVFYSSVITMMHGPTNIKFVTVTVLVYVELWVLNWREGQRFVTF